VVGQHAASAWCRGPNLSLLEEALMKSLRLMAPFLAASLFCQSASSDTVNARFPRQARDPGNVFTRMFPDLPPFAPQTDRVRNAVSLLGARGGVLDPSDDLSDPIQSIVDPKRSENNRDSATMTAGMTFFGQMLDHDITLDLRSRLLDRAQPERTVNFRSAAFDLDMVYGEGPERSPELYVQGAGDIKFIVEPIAGSQAVSRLGALRYDLPRDSSGTAIIGDSRNDENIGISQLHLAMLRFHNAVTDHLRALPENAGASPRSLFEQAQRLVQWHYQWIIVNEFLPPTVGQERVNALLRDGTKFYAVESARGADGARRASPNSRDGRDGRDGRSGREGRGGRSGRDGRDSRDSFASGSPGGAAPQIPIEFSAAAYRFGHSQVRPSYRLNFGAASGGEFFAFVFDDTLDPTARDPNDLRGGFRAPRRFVDWQTFFDFGDGNARPNKQIDTRISSVLMALPGSRAPSPGLPSDGVQSLASRNLIRHVNFGLPSGQAIAARMNVPALTAAQLPEMEAHGLSESTPLWYYVLKEAEVMEGGQRLGPVGAGIVGEVFVGLLQSDRSSYVASQPQWKPTLPSAGGAGTFRITDLLTFAGVVPPLQ
jgi:hypothetical protein